MKGSLLNWPCFGNNRSSDDADVDLDPVLLVTGMGGSIINSKCKALGISFETRVWVRIFLADLEFRKKALSVYNPKTGYLYTLFITHTYLYIYTRMDDFLFFFFQIAFKITHAYLYIHTLNLSFQF